MRYNGLMSTKVARIDETWYWRARTLAAEQGIPMSEALKHALAVSDPARRTIRPRTKEKA